MKSIAEIDALFALPLAEFTGARNALAARLKKDGRVDDAQRVRALSKPSVTAWAVNQLYWRHRPEFDRLVALSAKVRQAQSSRAAGLRSLLDERRSSISALAALAAALLDEAGNTASMEALRRVTTTLESLAARDAQAIALLAGRLPADLEPLGFESFAGLALAPPEAKVLDFRPDSRETRRAQEKQKAEAARAARIRAEKLALAEAALTAARRDAARAETAEANARKRRATLDREKEELDARYAAATREMQAAADEAEKKSRAVTDAERALTRMREEP